MNEDGTRTLRLAMENRSLRREAYYAGWVLVGNLLDSGHSLAELARVPEDRIPPLVESGIADLFGIDR